MLKFFTPVHVVTEERPQPPRPVPYGRWNASACPRPVSAAQIAAHNERRLVIWQRTTRSMLYVYNRHELTVSESGVKCVKPNAAADDWYDWTYYSPKTGDVLGWEYVNRSENRFETIGVCS